MPVKNAVKNPDKSSNYWYIARRRVEKTLKEVANLFHKCYFNANYVKKADLTRRIAGVSIRQESLRRPSIADWQCKYSLEGTCLIPRERCVSSLCPQIPKPEKESEKSYSYRILHVIDTIVLNNTTIGHFNY